MAIDEEDKKQIGELIAAALGPVEERFGKMLNGAIVKHTEPLKKALSGIPQGDALTELVTGMTTKALDEASAAAAAAGKKPEKGGGAIDPEVTRQLQELKTANEKLVKELAQGREAREKEKADRLALEERTAALALLSDAKISKGLSSAAYSLLRERGMIKRDEAGDIVLEVRGSGGVAEQMAIKDGIAHWLTTDEGKEFLPPRPVKGSGKGGERREQAAGHGVAEDGYTPPSLSDVAAALQDVD
jgi:hypothetical protein